MSATSPLSGEKQTSNTQFELFRLLTHNGPPLPTLRPRNTEPPATVWYHQCGKGPKPNWQYRHSKLRSISFALIARLRGLFAWPTGESSGGSPPFSLAMSPATAG